MTHSPRIKQLVSVSSGSIDFLLTLFLIFILAGCSSKPAIQTTTEENILDRLHAEQLEFKDGRRRFQEIFYTILDHHGKNLPDYLPNDIVLNYADKSNQNEPAEAKPVNLDTGKKPYIVGLVPGLSWQCVRNWMNNDNSGIEHLSTQGYDVRLFEVNGLSSTAYNAKQVKQYVQEFTDNDQDRPLILVGFSKGIADTLEAIVRYPELRLRTVAVASIAGAVGGSPLAETTSQSLVNVLAYIPTSGCDNGDEGAMKSLQPETRKQWLAENQLPDSIRYYSVIAVPEPERVSFGLRSSYKTLSAYDARNDGQLIFYDQLIPSSTLLGFVNADHWALSVPVARQIALNRITFANKNEYPREALLEAVLRYIEEDLLSVEQKRESDEQH